MLVIIINSFLLGISLSWGPCLASCGPVLIPYIAGTKANIKQGVLSWFLFSLGRVTAYLVIIFFALLFGQASLRRLISQSSSTVYVVLGSFLLITGIAVVYGKNMGYPWCRLLGNKLFTKGGLGAVVLGLFTGLLPCLPFLGVLAYLLAVAGSFWQGMVLGVAFCAGTVVSPLLFIAMGAAFIPGILNNQDRALRVFRRVCGILLCSIGGYFLIISFRW